MMEDPVVEEAPTVRRRRRRAFPEAFKRQAAVLSPADHAAENTRLRSEVARLRTERDILKKGSAHLRGCPPPSFGFARKHRSTRPVSVMCGVLGLSRN